MNLPQATERLRFEPGLLNREDGFAVPTVMLMLVAALALVSAGLLASVNAQRGTVRDQGTKLALASAESGVSAALLRYNRIATTSEEPCLEVEGAAVVAAGPQTTPPNTGWCEPVAGDTESGSYSYSVRPDSGTGELEIVSVGTVGDVSRRTHVMARTASGQTVFASGTALAQAGITMAGDSVIDGAIASNGDISLSGNAVLAGNATHGVGRQLLVSGSAVHQVGTVAEAQTSIPTVNPGDSASVNDNDRLFGSDPIYGDTEDVSWDSGTRRLEITENASVSLGGSVYSLCKLTLTDNASLYLAQGNDATIYFDSPEACGVTPGESQLETSSNSVITANSEAGALALLFVGSSAQATDITLTSNTQANEACEQSYVVYAPRTNVGFDSNARYCGALTANTITMDGSSRLETPEGVSDYVLPRVAAHYEPDRFVECAASASGAPDAGC
jgi:hypothetical protein